jgi:hypothetical protein
MLSRVEMVTIDPQDLQPDGSTNSAARSWRFPAGRYNDQVDAFSQALNRAFNRRRGDYACLPIGGAF